MYKNWGFRSHRNLELEVSLGTIQRKPIILWVENPKLEEGKWLAQDTWKLERWSSLRSAPYSLLQLPQVEAALPPQASRHIPCEHTGGPTTRCPPLACPAKAGPDHLLLSTPELARPRESNSNRVLNRDLVNQKPGGADSGEERRG